MELHRQSAIKGFLENTTSIFTQWLKHPFRVVDQLASIRPATVERRPFVGMHPHDPSIGILNGMGTKGCSLSPYFAHQLVNHLTENTPILPEADIKRFSRILNNIHLKFQFCQKNHPTHISVPAKFRSLENLHVLFWLVKDICWCIGFKPLGVAMIFPTLIVAIYIMIKNRQIVSGAYP